MTDQDNSISLNSLKNEMVFNPFYFPQENLSYYPFTAVSRRKRLLIHLAFWIISDIIITSFISLIKPAGEAIARGQVIILCLILLLYSTRILVNRFYEKKRFVRWVALSCLLILFAGALRAWFDLRVLHAVTFKQERLVRFDLGQALKLFVFFSLIALVFNALGSLYYIAKTRLILEHRYFKLKLQHAETQLSFLKAQVNPHFLFNTLNNIYAATELKNSQAPGMVLQLSKLLRYITFSVQQNKTDLAEEWGQIENYVKLFCLKNPEGTYPITLKTTGDLSKINISPMLLLPIVENAFKYSNIDEQADGSYLMIALYCSAEKLQFLVLNTYNDDSCRQEISGGTGNPNIRKRLQLEYPGQHTFQTEKENQVYMADLTINLI